MLYSRRVGCWDVTKHKVLQRLTKPDFARSRAFQRYWARSVELRSHAPGWKSKDDDAIVPGPEGGVAASARTRLVDGLDAQPLLT